MKRQIIHWALALALVTAMATSAGADEWAIKADYAESCNCAPACPCLFGSQPTHGFCDGHGLVEIKEGHYGDIRLDGISVVTIGHYGKGGWVKYYISENATDEQVKAIVKLMPKLMEPFLEGLEVLPIEKVSIEVERTAKTVMYSTPSSKVEIEMVAGRDGEPIRIQNLTLPIARGYTQYKSIINTFQSDDREFSYSGTNGFTATIDATSEQ